MSKIGVEGRTPGLSTDAGATQFSSGHGAAPGQAQQPAADGDATNFGRLTSGVAHEFNNIFQALLSILEMLKDRTDAATASAAQIQAALDLVRKGARLTYSLLSFSTSQLLRPQPLDIASLLPKLKLALQPVVPPLVSLHVSAAPELPLLLADVSQLLVALVNICTNACEAMPDGGALSLVVEGGPVAMDAACSGLSLAIRLSDTGEGMTPELLAMAKQPFFTTRGKVKRSGLGLSMADGFARQSGGSLVLESAPGMGTQATLRLPAVPRGGLGSAAPAGDGLRRILLVEDSPYLLKLYQELLIDAGYAVAAETDANKAMRRIQGADDIDLLITDFVLPGANGLELAELARVVRPGLMTLLISGFASPTQLASLPTDVRLLAKPFRSDQLLRATRELLAAATRSARLPAR